MNHAAGVGLRNEIAIGLSSYAAYLLVKRSVCTVGGHRRAMLNADAIVDLERRLGMDVEQRVQKLALSRRRAVDLLNVGYAAGNVALSVGWLIVMYRRGSPVFRRERRAAVVAFVGALPAFAAFPTAPPRTRDDFEDTFAQRGVDIEHRLLVRFYNPIAAMPSHHVAFAVVTGIGKAAQQRRVWRRLAWWTYPAAVSGVVVATGNHYVLDVAGGAVLGAFARLVAR